MKPLCWLMCSVCKQQLWANSTDESWQSEFFWKISCMKEWNSQALNISLVPRRPPVNMCYGTSRIVKEKAAVVVRFCPAAASGHRTLMEICREEERVLGNS